MSAVATGPGLDRRALAARLGTTGAVLGVLAGLLQATVGSRVPEWSGAKADPLPLGLLTVALSVLALVAARAPTPTPGRRAAATAGVLVPALLCSSTVGRLWLVPGALLLVAAGLLLAAGGPGALLVAVRARWLSVLVSALGACQALLAASAAPAPTLVVGVLGGVLLGTAPWLPGRHHLLVAAVGALPFAVLTWTSLVSPLVAVLALGLLAVDRRGRAGGQQQHPEHPGARTTTRDPS